MERWLQVRSWKIPLFMRSLQSNSMFIVCRETLKYTMILLFKNGGLGANCVFDTKRIGNLHSRSKNERSTIGYH